MEKVKNIIENLKLESSKSEYLTHAIIELAELLKLKVDTKYFRITNIMEITMPDCLEIEVIDEELKQLGVNDGNELVEKIMSTSSGWNERFYRTKGNGDNKRIYLNKKEFLISGGTYRTLKNLRFTTRNTGIPSTQTLMGWLRQNCKITVAEGQETVPNTDSLKATFPVFDHLKEIRVKHYFTKIMTWHGDFRGFYHHQIFSGTGLSIQNKDFKLENLHNESEILNYFEKFPTAYKQLKSEGFLDFLEDDYDVN